MHKRIISLSVVLSLLCATVLGRVGYIIFSNNFLVSDTYNSYSLTIDKLEPNLYYSNATKLTNNKSQLVAIIKPDEKSLSELGLVFDKQDINQVITDLSKGYPIVKKVDKYSNVKNIKIDEIKITDNTCPQLISRQSSGLLSYLPNSIGELKINYQVDALGHFLAGDDGEIVNNNYNSQEGYQLTLDNNIQQITYNAAQCIKSGCVIVLDVESCDILACVTKPDDSYINKAFAQYCVGSVFKIVVACCALENNIDITYNCQGQIEVGDTRFSCQNQKEHGEQSLKQALANSCNCYFVNLALTLGKDKLLATCDAVGFNDTTELFEGWQIKNANLPTIGDLKQKGELALFGFGQGKLTSSPLQICRCLCAIANDGYISDVKLIASHLDENGKVDKLYSKSSKFAISKSTSSTLIEYLSFVVTDGTGKNAQSSSGKSAGKTATAQTGQFTDDNEVLNTWFAGIYPNDNPKYAIVILCENGVSGATDCCPVFRTIVENLPD